MLVGGASQLGGSTSVGGSKTGGSSGSVAPDDRCGGIAGLKCATGSFCDYGACAVVVTDAMGTCVVKPQSCIQSEAPVCGCDGKTYSNDCLRRLAGVGKASDSACGGTGGTGGKTATGGAGGSASGGTTGTNSSSSKRCGGFEGKTCDTGEFCDYAVGTCGDLDGAGTCFKNSGLGGCGAVWQPVCGCNGRTYGNECERLIDGVSKRSEGECPKADGGVSDAGSASAALCSATGGEVKTQSCCTSVSDFPDSCVTGACGCAPTSSHVVSLCSCPNGCFIPGTGCVGNSGTCTVGVDHSCNNNPDLASIHGRCVTGGRCVCTNEFPLLANGKCL
jgi:hypothetical protein